MADGAERATITWTMQNWITIVLMVAIMFGAVGLVRALIVSNLPSTNT